MQRPLGDGICFCFSSTGDVTALPASKKPTLSVLKKKFKKGLGLHVQSPHGSGGIYLFRAGNTPQAWEGG